MARWSLTSGRARSLIGWGKTPGTRVRLPTSRERFPIGRDDGWSGWVSPHQKKVGGGGTVAERLACASPTKAIRAQYPDGSLRIFAKWESCRTTPLVGGSSRGSPVLSFRRCSILTSITFIGSQDLDKSRPNLFAHTSKEPTRHLVSMHSRTLLPLLPHGYSRGLDYRKYTLAGPTPLSGSRGSFFAGHRSKPTIYNLCPHRSVARKFLTRLVYRNASNSVVPNSNTGAYPLHHEGNVTGLVNISELQYCFFHPSPRLAVENTGKCTRRTTQCRAAVAERLARSPPTKANRAQSLAGSPDFRKWESCRTMPLTTSAIFDAYDTVLDSMTLKTKTREIRHNIQQAYYDTDYYVNMKQYGRIADSNMTHQCEFCQKLFPRLRLDKDLTKDSPAGSVFDGQSSGWISKDVFLKWLKASFERVTPSEKDPVLLIVDDHSSHKAFARSQHIRILSIPPHTTHRIQPLNKAVCMRKYPQLKISLTDIAGLANSICPQNRSSFTHVDFHASPYELSATVLEESPPRMQNSPELLVAIQKALTVTKQNAISRYQHVPQVMARRKGGILLRLRVNPSRLLGRKIMQGDMNRGKEGLGSHGLHFGAMTTSLSVLRASLNYEKGKTVKRDRTTALRSMPAPELLPFRTSSRSTDCGIFLSAHNLATTRHKEEQRQSQSMRLRGKGDVVGKQEEGVGKCSVRMRRQQGDTSRGPNYYYYYYYYSPGSTQRHSYRGWRPCGLCGGAQGGGILSGQPRVRFSRPRLHGVFAASRADPHANYTLFPVNTSQRATVAERLASSPPTEANRAQSPAGSPHSRKWESFRTIPLVGGYSRGSPASPHQLAPAPLHIHFNHPIGSEDLDVRSRPNLFTSLTSVFMLRRRRSQETSTSPIVLPDFDESSVPSLTHSISEFPFIPQADPMSPRNAPFSPPPPGQTGLNPSAGSQDLRKWYSCLTMPMVGGFSRESPVSPPFNYGAAPYSTKSPSSALKTTTLCFFVRSEIRRVISNSDKNDVTVGPAYLVRTVSKTDRKWNNAIGERNGMLSLARRDLGLLATLLRNTACQLARDRESHQRISGGIWGESATQTPLSPLPPTSFTKTRPFRYEVREHLPVHIKEPESLATGVDFCRELSAISPLGPHRHTISPLALSCPKFPFPVSSPVGMFLRKQKALARTAYNHEAGHFHVAKATLGFDRN
ncbi:hypothetical protein PR048_025456, partial [Dryococelus australis]